MDISKARCGSCERPLQVSRMSCPDCNVVLEGEFEVPPLARMKLEDQLFVVAFVRHHGSIKKMEALFGISYPTVKNRLNAITKELDRDFTVPSTKLEVLEQLERGEISVTEALEKMS